MSLGGPSLAHAQGYFTIPDTAPDYRSYRHIDECIAAISRLLAESETSNRVVSDTAASTRNNPNTTLPEHVIEYGAQCMEKVDPDTLSLEHADLWAGLLLKVNRDADAERIYLRLFEPLSFTERINRFSSVLFTFRSARPARQEMINTLYEMALAELPADSVVWQMGFRVLMADVYVAIGNDTLAERFIQEAIELGGALPRDSEARIMSARVLDRGVQWITEAEGLDSLRVSTDAFRRYREHHWGRLSPNPLPEIIAKVVPEIEGDYWFRSPPVTSMDAGGHTFPVPGKVNVIAFFEGGCHRESEKAVAAGRERETRVNCRSLLAATRRIKERYPDVQIVIVSKTYGSVGASPPLEPADEARTLAEYFLAFNRLDAVLAVTETPHFKISKIDGRRIDQPTANDMNYNIEGHPLSRHATFLLTDGEGKLFHVGSLSSPFGDEVLMRKIGAVLER